MNVKTLIEELKSMDQNSEVLHLWDSEPRTTIEHVYMGKSGDCITADFEQSACSNRGRPKSAPEEGSWQTPSQTKGENVMCNELDDYVLKEDVVDLLKGLKANLEITSAELLDHVDKAMAEINGETLRLEPLRLLKPITKELERKVQANLDRSHRHKHISPLPDSPSQEQ